LSGFFDAMGTITSVSDETRLTRDGKVEGRSGETPQL
jgi:adenine/guanine/hypoxanthine permease